MAKIIAYGEDGLTLWAMGHRLHDILRAVNDASHESSCLTYYRPSFGRKGGHKSAQFGEFDFILLSSKRVYLGESKWDRSSEFKDGVLLFRREQATRHSVMRCYIESWFDIDDRDWTRAKANTESLFGTRGIEKPIAPVGSRLETNLIDFLTNLDKHYGCRPEIENLLLFFYDEDAGKPFKGTVPEFKTVNLPYHGNGRVKTTV